jgi:DNA-binding transcriptional ArsR family regulator
MSSNDSQPERSPAIRELTDARTMRALTHPVRVALIEELVHGGAMTATELGERIGETATTCSFHLRQLAKYGFVEEAGGGRGRSRPWRLTGIGWSFTPGGDPAAELASEAALRLFRERQFARYETWRRTRGAYPPQWRQASEDSEYLFYLTAEETAQLGRELQDVLMRWFRLEGRLNDPARRPPGSLPVEMLLFSFPIDPPPPAPPAPPESAPSHPEDSPAQGD